MATVQELERAFLNAHNAGDKQAAQALAEALKSAMVSQPAVPAAPAAPKERTMLEAGKDILAGGVSGVGALTQLPGQIYGLATGDFSDTGLTKVGRELRETGESMKSAEFKRQEAERAAKIAEAGKKGELEAGITAFKETITNPSLLLNFLAEQAPNLIPGLAVARGLRIAGVGATGALTGAIGTGAVQQGADIGADTFKQMHKELTSKGMSNEEATGRVLGLAQAAGLSAAAISAGINALPFGRAIENAMAKVPVKGGKLTGMVKGGAGEAAAEMIEEGGGKVAQNVAMKQIKPEQSLTEGLGETMGMAAVGGLGLGTAAGLSRRGEVATLPTEETARPKAEELEKPPETVQEKNIPLLLEGKGAFVPVGLPDGSVAMTKEDLVKYEEEQFQKKYAPQPVERKGEFVAPETEEVSRPELTYADATKEVEFLKQQPKSPEVQSRIQELQTLKMDMIMDGIRRSREPVRPELIQLREQIESGVIPEDETTEFINQALADFRRATLKLEKIPTTEAQAEVKDLIKEANGLDKQIRSLRGPVTDRADDMKTLLRGKLTPEEVIDISPEKTVEYLASKEGKRSYSIADLVSDGMLDKWLPEEMRHTSPMFDAQVSEEFVKDILRSEQAQDPRAKILPFDTQDQIDKLSEDLSNLDARIQELKSPAIVQQAVEEIPVEERQAEAAQLAPEEGFVGMQEPLPAAPEETIAPVEEEYFPDKDELTAQQPIRGTAAEQAKFVINKDPEHQRIEKELTGKSMQQVAQWAVDNAPNQFAKVIAQKVMNRINGMASRGIKMDFEIVTGQRRPVKMSNARGMVDFDFGTKGGGKQPTFKLTLNGAAVVDDQVGYPPGARYITVLHELLHVATVGQTNILKGDDPIVKDLRDLFNKVVEHFNTEVRAGRITPFMQRMYSREINALTTPDELLAWGISDQGMQEFLSEIKVGEQTMMDKLVELIRKILNVTKPYLTALDQLVKTTESILDEDVNVVGDKIIAKQYSFGVAPGQSEAVQGTLFQQEEKQTPVQRAKATAQKALQKRTLPKSQFAHIPDDLYSELVPVFAPENKTIIDKLDGMRDKFWKKLAQGIADQYRSIRDIDPIAYMKARMSTTVDGAVEGLLFNGEVKLTDGALDIAKDTKGLIAALEPVGAEVDSYQIWVALNREHSIYEKSRKAYDKIDSIKGQIQDLGSKRRSAQTVKEANKISDQIEQMKKEVRALQSSVKGTSIDPDIVAKRNMLASGTLNGRPRIDVYKEVQKDMNKLNRSVLNIALAQGTINREAYEIYANDINYIPFYKVMEETGDVQTAATRSGLVNQYFSKALKGGEKPFGDLMENTLRNWSHILSSSMKNEAANATLRSAINMNAAQPNLKSGFVYRPNEDGKGGKVYTKKTGQLVGDLKAEYTTSEYTPRKGSSVVKTMIDGRPAYFEVTEPMLVESIIAIGYMGPKSKFLDVARNFKNILQYGVTISPAFKVRNLFRDSAAAGAVSEVSKDPVSRVFNNWASTDKKNPAHISALAGGAIFNFGSIVEGDQARLVKRLIKKGVKANTILNTDEKIKNGLIFLRDKYEEFGNKTEAVNRMALYNELKAKGKSHLESSFYARDMLDFSMQGAWPTFRYLTQIVPFLNARTQGLYKLGRDGIVPTGRVTYNYITGKEIEGTDKQKAQQFSTVMLAVALASLALYAAFEDDEEFQKREQWDRDNFWWFKLPGMDSAFRIPKPFEVGAFGTMVERTAEQIFDQGVEGKVFKESLSRMVVDTFAVNLPQIFKPLVDLYSNKDSFTGAPIETAGMERLSKAERIAEKTGPLAIALSIGTNVFLPESAEISPVQTDYAIKAYFGWLGGTASWLSHYAVQPFSKSAYPDNNWTDTLSMGFIKSLPTTQSKYVTAFYQNNKEIAQAYADMRHFAQLGEADKVQEIIKEKGDKIAMAKFYDNASKDMSKIRQSIQAIRNDENMSGAQKKEEIDRMKIIIGEIAKQMEEARIMVKKQYAASQ
jgi:hypothetical protein